MEDKISHENYVLMSTERYGAPRSQQRFFLSFSYNFLANLSGARNKVLKLSQWSPKPHSAEKKRHRLDDGWV